jgi:hypothetical protein
VPGIRHYFRNSCNPGATGLPLIARSGKGSTGQPIR